MAPVEPAFLDEPALALHLYRSDVEEFRRRFPPKIVAPQRARLEENPDDVSVIETSDGSYWLISISDTVALLFPRPNRTFGRGMIQYAAAYEFFELKGFNPGYRYHRTTVVAPARMIAEVDGWHRHTKGVLQLHESEPDE
jgi:hypothetical protein